MDKTKKTKLKYNKDWSWGYFMVAPTMIGLFILNIFPIFQTIYMSFTKFILHIRDIFKCYRLVHYVDHI